MRVLLTGNTGYLGSYLASELSRRKVDLFCATRDSLPDIWFDYIIFCNADTTNLSSQSSQSSIYALLKRYKFKYPNSKFIFFSSYYVYDNAVPATERDNTTDKLEYSKYKLLSEKYLNESDISFRIGKLFGNPYRINKNFIGRLEEDKEIFTDRCCFNPCSVYQVLDVIDYELKNKDLAGVYNLANSEISRHDKFAHQFKEVFGSNLKIKISPIFSFMPNYGKFVMNTNKIEKKIKLRNYTEDIKIFKKHVNSR